MENLYLGAFKKEKEFKKSSMQDIYIGINTNEPGEIVIINILKNKGFSWAFYKKQIETAFENIRYVGETEEGFVIVTKFVDGVFLLDYIEQNHLDIESKNNLFLTYLRRIIKYDHLDNLLKNALVDEMQIVVEHDRLYLNELIMADQISTKKAVKFEEIVGKIESVAKRIYYDEKQIDLPDGIKNFIEGLEKNRDNYSEIYDIYEKFARLYIEDTAYPLISGASPDLEQRILNNENSILYRGGEKFPKKRLLVILILAATITGYGLFGGSIKNQISRIVRGRPNAEFEKIQMKDGWELINKSKAAGKDNEIERSIWTVTKDGKLLDTKEDKDFEFHSEPGKYKVTLKVKDKYNRWSKGYSKEIIISNTGGRAQDSDIALVQEEKLEKLNLAADNGVNLMEDDQIFRSGKYSIKIIGGSDTNTIWIKDLPNKKNTSFSMWLLSDSNKDIQINFKGKYKGNIVFEKTLKHRPMQAGHWEMIQISDMGILDELGTEFIMDEGVNIWIDDIHFDTFK